MSATLPQDLEVPRDRSVEPREGEKVGDVTRGFGNYLDPRFVPIPPDYRQHGGFTANAHTFFRCLSGGI